VGCDCNNKTKKGNDVWTQEMNTLAETTVVTGVTVWPLNPTGVVAINGNETPAKSQGGFIDCGVEVRVLKQEAFGVVVEPIESK